MRIMATNSGESTDLSWDRESRSAVPSWPSAAVRGREKSRAIEADRQLKRLRIFALSIRIQKGRSAEHGRIVGIELHGRFDHLCAPLYLAPPRA
jgi:hypothetical protein